MSVGKIYKEDSLKVQLRNRFEDYRSPVLCDGLWDEIEKDVINNRRKTVAMQRVVALLSCVACIAIVFLIIPRLDNNEERMGYPVKNEITVRNADMDMRMENSINEEIKNSQLDIINSEDVYTRNQQIYQTAETESGYNIIDFDSIKVMEETNDETQAADKEESVKVPSPNKILMTNNIVSVSLRNDKSRKLELGVSTANLISSDISEQSLFRNKNNDATSETPELVERDIEYNQPLSFGLLVRKNLSNRFAFETGLTYTYLSSTEIIRSRYIYEENKFRLHYLGIPLKGIFNLYSIDRLSLYGGMGITIEKCVSGNITGLTRQKSSLKISEIQMSGMILGGINYKIMKKWSVFVEPNISYFFDDGASVRTIRKDKSFNFNIQGGIRFSY